MRRTKRALIVLALASTVTGLLATADTALFQGTAEAEQVEARNAADVFAAPGEQSRVVTRVRAGKEMTVLQTKNRWLKVRVNGRTGWITRSNVSTVELSEPAPRVKRRRPFVEGRSTRRGSRGKGPGDRIGGDATDEDVDDDADADDDDDDARLKRERKRARIKRQKAQAKESDEEILDEDDDERLASGEKSDDDDDDDDKAKGDDDDDDDEAKDDDDEEKKEPEREYVVVKVASAKIYEDASSEGEPINTASEGSKLFVVERDGKWIKVEDDEGNEGWVKASKVEDGDSGPGYQWEKFSKRARAGLGYASMTQNFTSNGATDPSYKLSSAAAVLSVGGDVLYDYSPTYLIGGDLGYRLQVASPGIRYSDGENSVNIGYKVHQLDLGVRGGYKLSKTSGMVAYARLGYHYERFGVNNVSDFTKNLAYLPSEILQGPTIGGIFEMPKLTEKFAVRAGIDYLKFLASRKQTVNLEDGSTSSPSALWLNLGTVYDWKPAWKITGDYQFTYAKTDWSGAVDGSMRPQMATSASRKDSLHLLMIGLGHTF